MRTSLTITLLAVALGVPALSPAAPRLQAGAAKVDVTPAERELPPGYEGILDRIYSRAIVIGDGTSLAALISVDAGAVPAGEIRHPAACAVDDAEHADASEQQRDHEALEFFHDAVRANVGLTSHRQRMCQTEARNVRGFGA